MMNIFNNIEYRSRPEFLGGRPGPGSHGCLYEGAPELSPVFQDHSNWFQFKAGLLSLASSSPSEAAVGARGSVITLNEDDVSPVGQRIERLGGSAFQAAIWARTAAALTPRTIGSRCTSGPGGRSSRVSTV